MDKSLCAAKFPFTAIEPGIFSDLELVLIKPGYPDRHKQKMKQVTQHNKSMRSCQRCQFYRITIAILDIFLGSDRLVSVFIAFHFPMF